MPFIPTEPQNGETVDADFLRDQFNALNDKPAPSLASVLTAGNDAGGGDICNVQSVYANVIRDPADNTQILNMPGRSFPTQMDFAGNRLRNCGDPGVDSDADTQGARNAAIAAAVTGYTGDIVVQSSLTPGDTHTLHYANGLLTGLD